MSKIDIDLVKAFVRDVASGASDFSRDSLRRLYLDDLSRRSFSEATEATEMWIDHYWNGIGSLSLAELKKTSRSEERLARLLIERLGK